MPAARTDDVGCRAGPASPLDPKNLGATLQAGRLFCQIGDPDEMDAELVIDQSEMDFVPQGAGG